MHGGGVDSEEEEEKRRVEESLVELKPEVVEFNTLHKREEELYFYDAMSYPWEKDKHYKMVYQLEKKYFPDQCLDKAFLQPGEAGDNNNIDHGEDSKVSPKFKSGKSRIGNVVEDDKKMVFFDEKKEEGGGGEVAPAVTVTEKKVEDFFKCLKKSPSGDCGGGGGEPYLVARNSELPRRWDGLYGTVVLINKPKGESYLAHIG